MQKLKNNKSLIYAIIIAIILLLLDQITKVIIIENNINDEKQLSVETIYTFNDKNICVSQRMKYEFSSNEEAKKEYDLWNEQKNLKNISISENIVSFNTDVNIGTAKDSIISNLEKSSSKYEIY